MRWLWILAGVTTVLGLALGLLARIGARLPRAHVAARAVVIRRPAAEVFAVIRDVARAPEWRKDVRKVTLLDEAGGRRRFREEGGHGAITFEVLEEQAPSRLVTRIADEDLPFAGSWTYELSPAGDGATRVTVTERGEVKPALFRALSKYVFTHHRTLEQYLRALAGRFGETARLEAPAVDR
jgi:uncharacterized protein YndB with AHSA1/START domain